METRKPEPYISNATDGYQFWNQASLGFCKWFLFPGTSEPEHTIDPGFIHIFSLSWMLFVWGVYQQYMSLHISCIRFMILFYVLTGYHSAFKTSDASLLIWSDGIFIFWTYHTPHMISVFLCSRILGTLICIWNNGRRYSICCFTILHTAISLSYRCLRHIWMLSQICR